MLIKAVTIPSNKVFCENIPTPFWNDLTDFSFKDTVDLWKISIKDNLSSLAFFQNILSQEELVRVNRYHQKTDKSRFTIGKGMLRILLANYLGGAPKDIRFNKGFNKKPFVDPPGTLQFNVSYSNNWIIIAISSETVGLDIEYINENFTYQQIMSDFFTKEEIESIMSATIPQNAFFKLWTRKEALLKATSWGLDDHLKDLNCLDGFQPISKKLGRNTDWQIRSFLMEKEYYISIATNNQKAFRYCNNSYSSILKGTGG
ncbi:MAG: 4'-phosphopantetheinyl transferase superfamily protein [Anditalea sp.]